MDTLIESAHLQLVSVAPMKACLMLQLASHPTDFEQ
jgi:hypothetical protein